MEKTSRFKRFVTLVLCKIYHRVEYIGEENVDFSKSNIFAANHINWLDGIFIWARTSNIAIMAKEELFRMKWLSKLLKSQGVFPIAREKKDFGSLYYAVNIIRHKGPKTLLVFPQGTRKATKKKVRAKNGAVYIAATTNTPIIPIYLSENRIPLPFTKVKVKYGKPFIVDIDKGDIKNKDILKEYTDKLMEEIYNLKG